MRRIMREQRQPLRHLRLLLILVLAASVPLPALASSLGMPHCQTMQQDGGDVAADAASPAQGTALDQPAMDDDTCDCDDGSACKMPCAVGGIAVLDSDLLSSHDLVPSGERLSPKPARALPAHEAELLRPPLHLQS